MTAAMANSGRGWMTIGEVLSVVNRDFPDMTISKIRFLETEGLISPQRAKSGYRRFTDEDVDQLRLVLIAQRDRYLPLRVIKEHLADGTLHDVVHPQPVVEVQPTPAVVEPIQPRLPFGANTPEPRPVPIDPQARFSVSEIVSESGLTDEQLHQLLDSGVVALDPAGRLTGADLQVCRAYRILLGFGVDQVDGARAGLPEPLDAVDGLDEVVERERESDVDGGPALLEVHALAEHHGLADEGVGVAVAPLSEVCFDVVRVE